ncbi:membrane hypothetical protein [Aeromicrobium sp. 9AM]|nr:membrane hypothetical protein [Aeromicrobium sp. 9AM]
MPTMTLSRLSRAERRSLGGMTTAIVLLHVVGWGLLAITTSQHLSLGTAGVFGLGLGITAYTLGLRHAFDADHIAAIDNVTRKLMTERRDGPRPLSVGFWFSLGHSSVVVVLCLLLAAGMRAIGAQVADDSSTLQEATGIIGTSVSGLFLITIGVINAGVLIGILRVTREMRRRLRRGRARAPPAPPRPAQPAPCPLHRVGHQAGPHVPGRAAVRPRVRHPHRGLPPGARRRRRDPPAPLVRPADPADPVHGRHVRVRQPRRRLHGNGLRLGVPQPRAQGLLQRDDDGPVRRRRLGDRRDRDRRTARQSPRDRDGTGGPDQRDRPRPRRLRDRRALRPDVGGRGRRVAPRPDRGTLVRAGRSVAGEVVRLDALAPLRESRAHGIDHRRRT